MKVLGFDVSSSTIGWAVLSIDKNNPDLIKVGHIKPISKEKADKKSFGMTYRANDAYDKVTDLIKIIQPDVIVIEDFSKKFTNGRSTAHTIITLAVFNSIVSLASFRQIKKEPYKYSASEMRNIVGRFYKTKIVSKDEVFPFIQTKYLNFKTTTTKKQNIKKEHYDEADAIFTALAYIIKNH